jgi:transcriptional regulator with XRE-family HTH domain
MHWKHELGETIKRARDSVFMGQEKLAKLVGVSRQMISRYESGSDSPSIDKLASIARVLELEQISVRGTIINFCQLTGSDKPRIVHRQLTLPFDRIRRFEGATVEIVPRKGRLVLTAVIPA